MYMKEENVYLMTLKELKGIVKTSFLLLIVGTLKKPSLECACQLNTCVALFGTNYKSKSKYHNIWAHFRAYHSMLKTKNHFNI